MGVSRQYKTVYNTRHSIQHSSHFVLVKYPRGKLRLGEHSVRQATCSAFRYLRACAVDSGGILRLGER